MDRREHEQELALSHCRGEAEELNEYRTEGLRVMMKSTATIENLATALNAFTGEIEDAKKGSQAHQYKYADLSTILQLARPLMHKHGLSVVQFPISDSGQVGILTRLMHNSGEWLEQPFMMHTEQSRGMSAAQSIGSVLTYFRRYALAAVLGIAQVDDDAAPQEERTQTGKEAKEDWE